MGKRYYKHNDLGHEYYDEDPLSDSERLGGLIFAFFAPAVGVLLDIFLLLTPPHTGSKGFFISMIFLGIGAQIGLFPLYRKIGLGWGFVCLIAYVVFWFWIHCN